MKKQPKLSVRIMAGILVGLMAGSIIIMSLMYIFGA